MAEFLYNFAQTTIDQVGGLCEGSTTFDVVDGSLLPSAPNYRVGIDEEILLVTGISANTLTVARGQEGTADTAHANGSGVSVVATAGGITEVATELAAGGGFPVWRALVEFDAGGVGLSSTPIFVTFDTIDEDPHGFFAGGVGTSPLVVPPAGGGQYMVLGTATIDTIAGALSATMNCSFTSSVVFNCQPQVMVPLVGTVFTLGLSGMLQLAAGDIVELAMWLDGGSANLVFAEFALVRVAGPSV